MATEQFFPGLEATAPEFVKGIEEEIKKRCPSARWKVLRRADGDITYHWAVDDCAAAGTQAEVARAFRSEDGLYVLHYNVRGMMDEKSRMRWVDLLNLAQLS